MKENEQAPPVADEILREIVAGTFAETGEAFFDVLVKHLARALGTKCAWVTEWLEEPVRLRALSFWVDEEYSPGYEYAVAGTPCESVLHRRQLIHVPERVIELFPGDPDLTPLGAVSYMGVPLFNTDGSVLGNLAVLHDEPLPRDPKAEAIFKIFAGRAAGELRRLRRDRELREREQKLSRLLGSAMDAIIELDGDFKIINVNPAAELVFGCAADELRGASFDRIFTAESRGKLVYLAGTLETGAERRPSLWIPDGIDAVRANGDRFPAEGTISYYEVDGCRYFALILRNINDRLDAAQRIESLMDQADSLRAEIEALRGFEGMIGESDALKDAVQDVRLVARGDTTVLIIGETGTGKELVASAIHQQSERAKKPFIKVNCAAIPESLQESEFFGHEQGAFTGATRRREGRFSLANGGSLFLDEVGELSLDLQAKLLRVLQEGEFEPVGSSVTRKVDVRVIAATHRDLETMVREGMFREDLWYRLNVFPLRVPPLRERGDDVVLLAEAFARKFARQRGRLAAPLMESAKAKLMGYEWPGNVRELQNVIERAYITSADGRTLNLERALPGPAGNTARSPYPPDDDIRKEDASRILTATEMKEFERNNILRALEESGWKISGPRGAAERLGLKPNTLSSRMQALGISRRAPSS